MIAVETCKRLGLGTNIMEGSELMTMEKHGNLEGLQKQVSPLPLEPCCGPSLLTAFLENQSP